MDLLFYIVLTASLVAGINTKPKWAQPAFELRVAEACLDQLQPLVRVSHRRVGGLWWRG